MIKIALLVVFFAMMLGVGIYSRNKAKNVNDYVLGGRTVGPWISAFAYGTPYFSADMQDSSDGSSDLHPHGSGLEMPLSEAFLHG